MQTFMPYSDFERSLSVLDDRRLGKQRIEAFQIVEACILPEDNPTRANHPAVEMWRGFEYQCARYGLLACQLYMDRGFQSPKSYSTLKFMLSVLPHCPVPAWVRDWRVHLTHRSNLLRKNPKHYRQFWPTLSDSLPYFYPTRHERFSKA